MAMELDLSTWKLYGRQKELQQLEAALEAVQSGCFRLMLIEGACGCGKSTIVDSFVASNEGKVLHGMGKFDIDSAESYTALASCLRQVCQQLLSDPEHANEWRTVLQNALKTEVRILSRFYPELEQLVVDKADGEWHKDVQISDQLGPRCLRLALRSFVRQVAQLRTMVLFLDDIHWADSESIGLIESLRKLDNVLLIVAHRRGERSEASNRLASDLTIEQIVRLSIGNLSVEHVEQILADLLQRQGEGDVQPLASAIHVKTGGNPFFLRQMVQLLYSRGILSFSLTNCQWMWDLNRVQHETDLTENVVVVLAEKMRLMSDELQQTLSMAAFIGSSQVDPNILAYVLNECEQPSDPQDLVTAIRKVLDIAAVEGLLKRIDVDDRYKFAHDHIKESAKALFSTHESEEIRHQRVGQRLRRMMDDSRGNGDQDNLLLLSVFHLNRSIDLLTTSEETLELAVLNNMAAKLALGRLSYAAAAEYLETAHRLLGDMRWQGDHYELTLEITSRCAHAQLFAGRPPASMDRVNEVLECARSLRDKVVAYRTLVLNLQSQNKPDEALHIVFAVLRTLGFPLPRRCVRMHIIQRLFRVRRFLSKASDDELLNMPPVEDDFRLDAALDLYVKMSTLCAMTGRIELHVLCLLEQILISLRRGRTKVSSAVFSSCAVIYARLNQLDTAQRFAKIAVELASAKRHPRYDGLALVQVNFFVLHHKMAYNRCLKPLLGACDLLHLSGATENLFLACMAFLILYFCCGLDLRPLYKDVVATLNMATSMDQRVHLGLFRPTAQMLFNLMGRSEDPLVLTGEAMNQEEFWEEYKSSPHWRAAECFRRCRLCLAVYFSDFVLAHKLVARLSYPDGPICMTPLVALFTGVTAFEMYRSTGRRKHLHEGRVHVRKLDSLARGGNPNCHHMLLLLRAEEKALRPNYDARDDFDQAIKAAGRLGVLHNQALANERAAIHCLRINDTDYAMTYLARAADLYERWGATAKVEQMKHYYAGMLDDSSFSMSSSQCFKLQTPLADKLEQSRRPSTIQNLTFASFSSILDTTADTSCD